LRLSRLRLASATFSGTDSHPLSLSIQRKQVEVGLIGREGITGLLRMLVEDHSDGKLSD